MQSKIRNDGQIALQITVEKGKTVSFTTDWVKMKTIRSDCHLIQTARYHQEAPKYLCKPRCGLSDVFASVDANWTQPGHPLTMRWSTVRQGKSCQKQSDNCNPIVIEQNKGLYMIGTIINGWDPLRVLAIIMIA